MINPRISAVWSTTKQIEPFSCNPSVQEVHTKAEAKHFTPGVLGLAYYSIVTHRKCIGKHMINPADKSTTNRLHHSLVLHVYKKYLPKLRLYTLPLVS